MKIELLSRTNVYSFTHDGEDYTVHIDIYESDFFFNHEIVDKDGNQIEGDHYDYLLKEFWKFYHSKK